MEKKGVGTSLAIPVVQQVPTPIIFPNHRLLCNYLVHYQLIQKFIKFSNLFFNDKWIGI